MIWKKPSENVADFGDYSTGEDQCLEQESSVINMSKQRMPSENTHALTRRLLQGSADYLRMFEMLHGGFLLVSAAEIPYTRSAAITS